MDEKFIFCGKMAKAMEYGPRVAFCRYDAMQRMKTLGLDAKYISRADVGNISGQSLMVLKGPGQEYFTVVDNYHNAVFAVHVDSVRLCKVLEVSGERERTEVILLGSEGRRIRFDVESFEWWKRD